MSEHRRARSVGFVVLGRAAAWSLTAAVVLVVGGTVLVPRLAGATPYVITTGSMAPTYPPGTTVVTRPVAAADVRVGAVVTYQLAPGRPTVVTHRVVAQGISAAGETVLRTRGDANAVPDAAWVRPVQLRGTAWYAVPYVGHVTVWLGGVDRVLLERTGAVLLLGYAGLLVAGGLRRSAAGREIGHG